MFVKDGEVIPEGEKLANHLYCLNMRAVNRTPLFAGVVESLSTWHQRLYHQSKSHIKELLTSLRTMNFVRDAM